MTPADPRTLKSRIAAGDRLRGLLVRIPSTMLIDMAGNNGFDLIFLDTEHGIADQKDVIEHLTAARAAGLSTLVRIGEGEAALALRVLDAGAEGVIVPHLRDANAAAQAVRMAHYPPVGDRGLATYTAAGRWGKSSIDDHAAHSADRTVVVGMIEDAAGVQNTAEILNTPGLDVVTVGLTDLAASLGYDASAADTRRAQVWSAAARYGVATMAIVSDPFDSRHDPNLGAQIVVLNAQAAVDATLAAWISHS